jgi:O-antigen/teichoic acid export membrane protein
MSIAEIPLAQATPVAARKPPEATGYGERIAAISRHSAVYFGGTILTATAGYFFKIYLARALGAEALGLYALGMSIVGFLGLFSAFGLPQAAARFVAEYRGRGEFIQLGAFLRGSLGLLSVSNLLLGGLVLAAGPWIAVHFYRAPALNSYFGFFVLIMSLGVLNTFLGQTMAGYQDVARRTIITHFTGTPANIVMAVILIGAGLGLRGYLAAQVASALLVLTMLALSVWNLTPIEARVLSKSVTVEKEVVAFSITAFGMAAVDFVLTQTDKIVLGCYLNPAQVGIYAVAMGMVAFVPIALQSVNQTFAPTIAELHANGNHEVLQQLYATLTKWILVLTLPMAFTMIVFARPLIGLFGRAFEAGAIVLIIGAVGQLFNCAVGSVGYLLLMSGHEVQLIKIQACNAVAMVALNLLLVPRFGITGAAAASAVSVIVTNLWCLAAVHRGLKLQPYNASYKKLVAPAIVCAILLAVLLHASSRTHSLWAIASLGFSSAYISFLATFFCFGLDSEDRRLARVVGGKLRINFRRIGAIV